MAELARKKRNSRSPEIRRNSTPGRLDIIRAGIYTGSVSQSLVGQCLGFNGHTRAWGQENKGWAWAQIRPQKLILLRVELVREPTHTQRSLRISTWHLLSSVERKYPCVFHKPHAKTHKNLGPVRLHKIHTSCVVCKDLKSLQVASQPRFSVGRRDRWVRNTRRCLSNP